MKSCPNCGADLSESRRLVRTSAKELVESLRIDADMVASAAGFLSVAGMLANCRTPDAVHNVSRAFAESELEPFKDRMRASGYKTNAGPVRDAHAAFRTHLRNAVKFAAVRKPQTVAKKATVAERKEL